MSAFRNIASALLVFTPAIYAQWLSYGLTPDETRYSPLREINTSNVGRLGLAWSYVAGAGGSNQEATPLVWNNTIYGITSWSVVFAVDAVTGKELWRWDPEVNQTTVRPKLCCGIVSRGLAISDGTIFAPIVDGRLVALDAVKGTVKWEARVFLYAGLAKHHDGSARGRQQSADWRGWRRSSDALRVIVRADTKTAAATTQH